MAYAQIILLVAFALSACGFAAFSRGFAERVVAAVVVISIPVGFVFAIMPVGVRPLAELAGDGVIAFLILGLALRYPTRWLGAVLILYAGQFALHSFYFVTSRALDEFYLTANNLIFLGVNIALLIGAAGTVRHRTRVTLKQA